MRGWLLITAISCQWLAFGEGPYAGSQACAACHKDQFIHQRATPMAHALEPVAAGEILKRPGPLTFREGLYTTEISREGDRSVLTVTAGSEKMTVPLLWAFGLGQAGQTYVFEFKGAFYESRVSFFNNTQGLDLTLGAQNGKPTSIEEAAGRRMEKSDARACFGCHSTGGVRQAALHFEELSPGVGCEACHGLAAGHIAAIKSGNLTQAKLTKLGALSTEEMSDLCGTCHRTWSQIAANGPRGVNNVRFQPYRLTNSKCYDAADARVRCTACHDPHRQLVRDEGYYDARCRACHALKGTKAAKQNAKIKSCPVAQHGCAGCHMPKVELPGAHTQFTDHQIRIARAGDPYPN